MSFEVIATEPFERKLKKLAKKHKSLKADLEPVIDQLANTPDLGTPLGKDCYKIRVVITSKGKGKSGGARIITYVRVVKETVYLMDIYDKSDQSTISDKELKLLIDLLAEE
ncbi:MAG: type II toxin-antitoxin system RelE/ParE family toxin [Cyclobacteriaceae bacterium]|nr:type II toxin-antitoxin system RelE/ParE family toxin [Cyclobacteriaceae bacterium]